MAQAHFEGSASLNPINFTGRLAIVYSYSSRDQVNAYNRQIRVLISQSRPERWLLPNLTEDFERESDLGRVSDSLRDAYDRSLAAEADHFKAVLDLYLQAFHLSVPRGLADREFDAVRRMLFNERTALIDEMESYLAAAFPDPVEARDAFDSEVMVLIRDLFDTHTREILKVSTKHFAHLRKRTDISRGVYESSASPFQRSERLALFTTRQGLPKWFFYQSSDRGETFEPTEGLDHPVVNDADIKALNELGFDVMNAPMKTAIGESNFINAVVRAHFREVRDQYLFDQELEDFDFDLDLDSDGSGLDTPL